MARPDPETAPELVHPAHPGSGIGPVAHPAQMAFGLLDSEAAPGQEAERKESET